jgi:hypothetical protein
VPASIGEISAGPAAPERAAAPHRVWAAAASGVGLSWALWVIIGVVVAALLIAMVVWVVRRAGQGGRHEADGPAGAPAEPDPFGLPAGLESGRHAAGALAGLGSQSGGQAGGPGTAPYREWDRDRAAPPAADAVFGDGYRPPPAAVTSSLTLSMPPTHPPSHPPAQPPAQSFTGPDSPDTVGSGGLPHRTAGQSWPAVQHSVTDPAIHGTVAGADGTPIPDAALTVINVAGGQVGRGRTASSGAYLIRVPGSGQYVLIARAAGHEPHARTVTVDGLSVVLDLTLASAVGLAGTVRQPDGTPAAGATIILTNLDGAVVGSQLTDATGGYQLSDLSNGIFTLTVAATGYEPVAALVDLAGRGLTRQDVDLVGGLIEVRGTATLDRDSRPLADVRVSLLDESGAVLAVTHTDDEGRYVFTGVASGVHTVVASGYPPTASQLVLGEQSSYQHDVVLGYQGGHRQHEQGATP